MKNIFKIYVILFLLINSANAQKDREERLVPPILLENEQRLSGNPLATYAAMLEKETQYLQSPLSTFYEEQKLNMEQFMGIPDAGLRAMSLKHMKNNFAAVNDSIPKNFIPKPAISIIEKLGEETQIIIWGEEHHLPQTRVLYKDILEKLWEQGFRYLAAETFSQKIEQEGFLKITASSGYYLQDPIYANAVQTAIDLGYQLVAYDNNEDDRDKVQAENIYNKIFKKNPQAKVFIIAGRGHIAEYVQSQNWKPMGFWLKQFTGIDPFTIYAPTMSERLEVTEMHPFYRYAIENNLINDVTIFQDSISNNYLGQDNGFDAYVFFPQSRLLKGRPEWMLNILNRHAFEIPTSFLNEKFPLLVQARFVGTTDDSIPIDQLLILNNIEYSFLALPYGEFIIRSINAKGEVLAKKIIRIE